MNAPVPRFRWSGRPWLAFALVAVVGFLAVLPVADDIGEGHVDDAFRRALLGYAVARGLNGAISVAQGTEVAVQPAGVGVNFAPGEILDPVNDLVERFSWIMMLAASSLGVQKVLLAMSGWAGLAAAVVAVGVLWLVGLGLRDGAGDDAKGEATGGANGASSRRFRPSAGAVRAAGRVFLFLAVLRFLMPVVAIGNDWAYRTFLEDDWVEASAELERASERIGALDAEVRAQGPPDAGRRVLRPRARRLARERGTRGSSSTGSIDQRAIRLIVVFVMQSVVFPLLTSCGACCDGSCVVEPTSGGFVDLEHVWTRSRPNASVAHGTIHVMERSTWLSSVDGGNCPVEREGTRPTRRIAVSGPFVYHLSRLVPT